MDCGDSRLSTPGIGKGINGYRYLGGFPPPLFITLTTPVPLNGVPSRNRPVIFRLISSKPGRRAISLQFLV
ncbi:MAG: hypothetical protein ACYS91_03175 [Planctomycetota bacterium]